MLSNVYIVKRSVIRELLVFPGCVLCRQMIVLPCRGRNWFALLAFVYQANFSLIVLLWTAGGLGQPTTRQKKWTTSLHYTEILHNIPPHFLIKTCTHLQCHLSHSKSTMKQHPPRTSPRHQSFRTLPPKRNKSLSSQTTLDIIPPRINTRTGWT